MNRSKIPVLAVLTAVLAGAAVASRSTNALAQCGMGEVDWYGAERANVASARELLEQGEPRKAAWVLQQTWPRLREAIPVEGSVPVIADGVQVMALAIVRADGDVRSGLGWASWSAGERAANVGWAVSRLRMLAVTEPWNPEVKVALGEALSKAPGTRAEARDILEGLEVTGALTAPEGYAALALIRAASGDTTGAEIAALECERRATRIGPQCEALGGRVTPAVTAER